MNIKNDLINLFLELKDTLLSLFFATSMGLLAAYKRGKRNIMLLTEGFAAFFVGWVIHYLLLQYTNLNLALISGFAGFGGWVSTKILERLEDITDAAADRIEDQIREEKEEK